MSADRWIVRAYVAAVRVLYRHHPNRVQLESELEASCAACIARERGRLRALGVPYACMRLAQDAVVGAVAMHLDRRRAARIAALAGSDLRKDALMTTVWQDIRYAFRGIRRAPVFNAVVICALAVAIGTTTALFGVVNAVLLRPLPFPDADRLVIAYEAIGSLGPFGFSAPDYEALESRITSVDSIGVYRNRQFEISGVSQPERITAAVVSASLFRTLGVSPALGRAFTRDEDEGSRKVAILSDGLWRRAFAADPSVLGRPVILDRLPYTIVGVMPAGFTFPSRGPHINNLPADVFMPISFSVSERRGFGSMYNNTVVARLKPGVTAVQADIEIRAIVSTFVREIYPATLQGLPLSASAAPMRDETVGRIQTLLYVLFAAVVVVLLIACADIANLMLTRATAREREMAVRTALGAGRGRLIALSLVESGIVAACGGVLGLMLARWTSAALVRIAPAEMPRLDEVTLDLRVFAFAVATTALTAVLCGLLPALELSRRPGTHALKEGGRTGTPGRRQRRIFGTLVTAQFALAAVLLAGGGLLVRSFVRLTSVDPGFRPDHVLTFATSLPAAAYAAGSDVRRFYTEALERIERLPGVTSVAASTDLPLSVREHRSFTIETPASPEHTGAVAHNWVTGRYFETLGIALRSGRYFGGEDVQRSELVVVINESLARQYWRGADPVGQRIAWGNPADHGPWMRIVGVVADVKHGPLHTITMPQTYQPWAQMADAALAENVAAQLRSMKILVRTGLEPTMLAGSIREELRAIDPALPVTSLQTMEQVVAASTGPQRFNTVLLASFAAVALLLAALGIAGVLATSVSRRTPEIGVRMALGAQRRDLLRMIVGQGMALAAAGLALGVLASLALTRLMSTLLFEISPRDPVTFGGVAASLLLVALIACYLPARSATRVDPMAALRHE